MSSSEIQNSMLLEESATDLCGYKLRAEHDIVPLESQHSPSHCHQEVLTLVISLDGLQSGMPSHAVNFDGEHLIGIGEVDVDFHSVG